MQGLASVTLLRRTAGIDAAAALAAAEGTDDVAAHTVAADLELLASQVTECFDRLIALVRRTSGDDREAAKNHLLELLDLVGNEDPRVLAARRSLANALF
jgi:putative thioredoxin